MAATRNNKLTLTTFMDYSRKFWAGFGLFLACLTVYGLFTGILSLMKQEVEPCEEVIPSYAFADGNKTRISAAEFPAIKDPPPATYNLAIRLASQKNGELIWPRFGEVLSNNDLSLGVAKVYKLQPLVRTFNADQAARNIARNLGFNPLPQILDSHTVAFSRSNPPLDEILQIDLQTMFVTLKTNALSTTNYYGTTTSDGIRLVPDRVDALNAVTTYLAKAGLLPPEDLSQSSAQVEYYRSTGADLELVESEREADYAMVPLSHQPIEGIINRLPVPGQCQTEETRYRFFGPDNFPSIKALVGRNFLGEDEVVSLEDYYYQIDYSDVATYPLRSVESAWQQLVAGQAYVVNPRQVQDAVIKQVELGYYESHQEQNYLVPIYVFSGENGVVAYVQALHPEVLE